MGDGVNTTFRQLVAPFPLRRLVPTLTSGLLIGLIQVILSISFGALIFTGPLSPFIGRGIGLALVSAALSGATVALFTSFPGTVAGNQDVPAAIMALSAAAIAEALPAEGGSQKALVTVVVALGLTTALTGLLFYGLGRFRLGSLVRYIPYPVLGGFLAGTGWLLMHGALGIMVNTLPPLSSLGQLLEPDMLLRWLPGVLLGALILFVLSRTTSVLALPAIVLVAAALFYGVVFLGGLGLAGASAEGWLLGPFPSGRLWPGLSLADLDQVYWPALLLQLPAAAAVGLMSAVALLLNVSGLELSSGAEVDFDRELQAAGAGSAAAGLVGGLVGYQQLSLSAMNQRVHGGRLAPLLGAALCAAVLFLGGTALSLFPKVVLGGLLFSLGLSFVLEWAVQARRRLPPTDYAIILLILLVTAVAGFLEAVGVGLLVAVVLFVVNYSRIDVVRFELTGAHVQSRVSRRPAQRQLLLAQGDRLHILRLQGFIFFGTADRLVDRVRRRLEDAQQRTPSYLLLDFRQVTGIDSTSLWSFRRLHQLTQVHGVSLVLTALSPAIRRQFSSIPAFEGAMPSFPDLDRGCEWCETQLLTTVEGAGSALSSDPLRQELQRILGQEGLVEGLLAYFERQERAAGSYLMRQGDAPDLLFFIESGRVTAQLEGGNGEPARLQTMEGGHLLGELGFFLGLERTADVVADTPCVIHRLSQQGLAHMRADQPAIASALQQVIIHKLAERVVHLVTVVEGLQQ